MRLSVAELDRYREALAEIASMASDHVYGALSAMGGHEGVTAMREAAIEAITETVGIHGDMAQALAGQLFDEVCDAEGLGAHDFAVLDDVIDLAMLEEKVRYFARALVEGDGGRFLDDCSELAAFYVRRCNWEAMVRNCESSSVAYARIPSGTETCDFCLMLASRGFVYRSRDTAMHEVHHGCDCLCVPGRAGRDGTQVEGYDPDALYRQWQDMVDATARGRAERNGTAASTERASIMAAYARSSARAKQRARARGR